MHIIEPSRYSPWTAAIAVLTCLLAAAQVEANEPVAGSTSTVVRYGDLNLSTTAGASTLYGRIRGAAQTVCGFSTDRSLGEQREMSDCRRRAIAAAVARVDSPLLTALHKAE